LFVQLNLILGMLPAKVKVAGGLGTGDYMTRMAQRRRGFTLIELMIVVSIMTVLAVTALVAYRKYTATARNAEAMQFLGAVRAAQEGYFQAWGQYCGERAPSVWPSRIPGGNTGKLSWDDPDNPIPDNNAWHDLGIRSPGLVWFQYRLAAGENGGGGEAIANDDGHWFWAQANGDFDMDTVLSTFEVTSEKAEVYINNENE
jgi:prepilin-type N-terminal cleavage/methylation domain-containing protein